MDNDQVNSAENQSASDNPPASEKPPRSKVERIVVWSLIGLLAIFAAVEAQSQIGYRKSLEAFESADDKNEETLTLDLFEAKLKKCFAVKTNGTKNGQSTILYKWPSLLRNYEMHFTLIPGEDQLLASFATHDSPAGMIGQPNQENDLVNDPGPEEGEGPGGPGGPGAHGEEGDSAAASGGRQRGGRRGGGNNLRRLLAENLQAELQLTEEQKTQIQDLSESRQIDRSLPQEERAEQREVLRREALAKLREFLEEEQFARAKQILLHARGVEALMQEDVAAELELSQDQRDEIAALIEANREKRRALFQQVRDGEIERSEMGEKLAELREEGEREVLAVLTEEQQKAWKNLLGPAPPEPGDRPE